MFAKSVIAFAAAAAFVNAAPVEQKRGAPKDWAWGYLEDYDTYHVRYLAIKCYEQKKTQFFDDCCHPLLSTENLKDNRAAYCTPSDAATESVKASLAAKAAGGAASSTASADSAAESEYCEEETSAAAATTAAPAATQSPSKASPAASPSATTSAAGEQKWAQPSTTTTQAWTPAPTTQAAKTTQAAATTQQSSGGGGSYSGGYATYFYQGGNAGACGTVHGDYDMIVAIDHEKWGSDSYGSGSSTCGRWLTITNTNNGKSVSAMVADVCPTCANGNSLDLSVGAFQAIASLNDGMVPISWSWN